MGNRDKQGTAELYSTGYVCCSGCRVTLGPTNSELPKSRAGQGRAGHDEEEEESP